MRPVRRQPACAEACPTGAITFIDANWTGLAKMQSWADKLGNQNRHNLKPCGTDISLCPQLTKKDFIMSWAGKNSPCQSEHRHRQI